MTPHKATCHLVLLLISFFNNKCLDTVEENVPFPSTDDGTGPEKMALIMGPPDRCQHAASIITDLLQSVRAREEGGQVSMSWSSLLKLRLTSWVETSLRNGPD